MTNFQFIIFMVLLVGVCLNNKLRIYLIMKPSVGFTDGSHLFENLQYVERIL